MTAGLLGGLLVASLTACSASGPSEAATAPHAASPSSVPDAPGGGTGATGDDREGDAGADAPGRTTGPGSSDAFSSDLVDYVDCMTERGVEGLDREAASNGVLTMMGVDHDDPVFRSADEACSDAISQYGGGGGAAGAGGTGAPADPS